MKKLIDKKIVISFFIGGLFFSIISVYGIPAISGADISYSNATSKLTAFNVQGAIDELNSKTKEGDATTAQILKDKTALVGGTLITGSMPNQGAWTSTPTTSGNVTIPAGYHNGSGYVDTSSVYSAGENSVWDSIKNDTDLKARGYSNVSSLATLKTAINNDNSGSIDKALDNIKTYINASGSSTDFVASSFGSYTFSKPARIKLTFSASCNTTSYGSSTSQVYLNGSAIISFSGYQSSYGPTVKYLDVKAGDNIYGYTRFNQTDYRSSATLYVIGVDL